MEKKLLYLYKSTICIFSFLVLSCEKSDFNDKLESFHNKTFKIPLLDYTNSIQLSNENISFEIGVWLYKSKYLQYEDIANWLGIQHKGKFLLEPINILWIDLKAKNKNEAVKNVEKHLSFNDFHPRSGSSEGYYGNINGEWFIQHNKTWSNKASHLVENNHGRVFISNQVKINSDKSIFISTAAFSIETKEHLYLSFKKAKSDFLPNNDWKLITESYDLNNSYFDLLHSTDDHDGVKIFILK